MCSYNKQQKIKAFYKQKIKIILLFEQFKFIIISYYCHYRTQHFSNEGHSLSLLLTPSLK